MDARRDQFEAERYGSNHFGRLRKEVAAPVVWYKQHVNHPARSSPYYTYALGSHGNATTLRALSYVGNSAHCVWMIPMHVWTPKGSSLDQRSRRNGLQRSSLFLKFKPNWQDGRAGCLMVIVPHGLITYPEDL